MVGRRGTYGKENKHRGKRKEIVAKSGTSKLSLAV